MAIQCYQIKLSTSGRIFLEFSKLHFCLIWVQKHHFNALFWYLKQCKVSSRPNFVIESLTQNSNNNLCKRMNHIKTWKKYIKKFHHILFMVQNLEFQIYLEKMLERPRSLFMQKRLYENLWSWNFFQEISGFFRFSRFFRFFRIFFRIFEIISTNRN